MGQHDENIPFARMVQMIGTEICTSLQNCVKSRITRPFTICFMFQLSRYSIA
jgi:hypothetical protein